MARWLSKTAEMIDRRMERFILDSRSSGTGSMDPRLSLLVLTSLPTAAVIKYFSGPYNPFDLFTPSLILCSIAFGHLGLLTVLLAGLLDVIVKALEIHRLGRPDLWPRFLIDTGLNLLEWTVVCCFVIITLEKWATLRSVKQATDDDLALAKSFQSSLAQRTCELQRVRICGSIHQCASVGGDFYYFRPFGKKMVSFCVGDVMGKGISASLLMAMVMSFVYEWGKQSTNPAEIAGRLNRRLSRLWDGRKGWFITIFYALLDEESGRLEYCAAGQSGGFILRRQEIIDLASDCDPPLGVMDPYEFTPHSIQLEPGDQLLLFTDGVYEARSPEGVLFGVDRLRHLFKKYGPELQGTEVLARIEAEVLTHTGGVYTDDTTLLSVRYLP